MKCTIALLSLLLCVSCTLVSPTENATNSAKTQLEALEKSLASTCKTDGINAQLNAIKTQIASIEKTCEAEKATLKADKAKWKIISLALVSLIGLYFGMKFLK